MSFVEFLKKNLMNFFIIVTCITAAIGILGSNFDPNAVLGYEAFFSPIIFGLIATVPSFILYSPKELSFEHMLLRRVLHFITLELLLIGFGYLSGILKETSVTISYAISIFIVYLITNVVQWIIDSRTADSINKGLKGLH
jgi:hypothetical protein